MQVRGAKVFQFAKKLFCNENDYTFPPDCRNGGNFILLELDSSIKVSLVHVSIFQIWHFRAKSVLKLDAVYVFDAARLLLGYVLFLGIHVRFPQL